MINSNGSPALVDVVLPCLDEAAALPTVIGSLPAGWRAVVVDNGSTDGSATVAARLGATVVVEPRRGYGAAVDAGLQACTAEFVAVMDCDGSLDGADLPALHRLVAQDRTDIACGRRRPIHRGVWPWHARLATAGLARMVRSGGIRLHDLAPLRVARRSTWLSLGVTDRRFGYPLETFLTAGRLGLRVSERDVVYRPRAVGTRSKISGTVRGTVSTATDFGAVLWSAHRRRPAGRPGRAGVVR